MNTCERCGRDDNNPAPRVIEILEKFQHGHYCEFCWESVILPSAEYANEHSRPYTLPRRPFTDAGQLAGRTDPEQPES